jgi:hypothetical protein
MPAEQTSGICFALGKQIMRESMNPRPPVFLQVLILVGLKLFVFGSAEFTGLRFEPKEMRGSGDREKKCHSIRNSGDWRFGRFNRVVFLTRAAKFWTAINEVAR